MFKKHFLFPYSAFDICNITTHIVSSDFIHSLIFTLQWNIFFFIQTQFFIEIHLTDLQNQIGTIGIPLLVTIGLETLPALI